jgi:hypothetical protein
MRVELDAGVLNDPAQHESIDRLVHFFREGRHLWHVQSADEVKASAWYLGLANSPGARRVNELLERSVQRDSYRGAEAIGAHHLLVRVVPHGRVSNANDMSVNDAYKALEMPAYVAVEDACSDAAFIDALVYAFGQEALHSALVEGWLQVEHMGSCGQVERALRRIQSRRHGPIRTVVLVDSDRLVPEADTNNTRALRRHCPAFGAVGIALRKREAENYIPLALLPASSPADRRRIRALARMTQVQRDVFDMKKGFTSAGPGKTQEAIYSGLGCHDLLALKQGFGEEVWTVFQDKCAQFTPDGFRGICPDDSGEIERILAAIEAQL